MRDASLVLLDGLRWRSSAVPGERSHALLAVLALGAPLRRCAGLVHEVWGDDALGPHHLCERCRRRPDGGAAPGHRCTPTRRDRRAETACPVSRRRAGGRARLLAVREPSPVGRSAALVDACSGAAR